jgi:hypothetical protein
MSTPASEATTDYTTGSGASRGAGGASPGLRTALCGLAFLAAALLVASTFMTLLTITTGEAELDSRTGYDHHSIALLLLGVAVLPMALGSLRGARPAMAGVAALGVIVLVVVMTVDLPATLKEGLFAVRYENAEAQPAIGFYVETLAGVLLVLSGGLMLLLGGGKKGALADAV